MTLAGTEESGGSSRKVLMLDFRALHPGMLSSGGGKERFNPGFGRVSFLEKRENIRTNTKDNALFIVRTKETPTRAKSMTVRINKGNTH